MFSLSRISTRWHAIRFTVALFGVSLLFSATSEAEAQSINSPPGFGASFAEDLQWIREQFEFAQHSRIPWLQARSALELLARQYPSDENIFEEQYQEKRAAYEAFFEEISDDPKTLAFMAQTCALSRQPECTHNEIFNRRIASDPDNLDAYLTAFSSLEIDYGLDPTEQAELLDTEQVRQWLIDASRASTWEPFGGKVARELFQFHLEFIASHPPPTPMQRQNPDYVLAFWLGRISGLSASRGIRGFLPHQCAYYMDRDPKMAAACQRLATSMKSLFHPLAVQLERAITPESDLISEYGLFLWRQQEMERRVSSCIRPDWLYRYADWPWLPRSWFEQHVNILSQSGWREASIASSQTEYEFDPSRYDLPPKDCMALMQLDSAAMGLVLGDTDPFAEWQEYVVRVEQRQSLERELAEQTKLAFVPASTDELALMASELDQIENRADPRISALTQQGLPVVPFLLDQVCVPGNASSLTSIIITNMRDPAAIPLLLDQLAWEISAGMNCDTASTLHESLKLLGARGSPDSEVGVDPDWLIILQQSICETEQSAVADMAQENTRGWPLVVEGSGVETPQSANCAGEPVELHPWVPYAQRLPYAKRQVLVASLITEIFDLGDFGDQSPDFTRQFGGNAEALAIVRQHWSSRGQIDLWARVNDEWVEVVPMSRSIQ